MLSLSFVFQRNLLGLPYDAHDEPIAQLFVVSTVDSNPVQSLNELLDANQFPSPFGNEQYDPNVPKIILLLHDVGSETASKYTIAIDTESEKPAVLNAPRFFYSNDRLLDALANAETLAALATDSATPGTSQAGTGSEATGEPGIAASAAPVTVPSLPKGSLPPLRYTSPFHGCPLHDPSVVMREIKFRHNPNHCFLLPINSTCMPPSGPLPAIATWTKVPSVVPSVVPSPTPSAPTPVATPSPTTPPPLPNLFVGEANALVPDVWAPCLREPLSALPPHLPLDLCTPHAAPAAVRSHTPLLTLMLQTAMLPARGCCLTGNDLLLLQETLSRVLRTLVIPAFESSFFALQAQAQKHRPGIRGKITSFLGGALTPGATPTTPASPHPPPPGKRYPRSKGLLDRASDLATAVTGSVPPPLVPGSPSTPATPGTSIATPTSGFPQTLDASALFACVNVSHATRQAVGGAYHRTDILGVLHPYHAIERVLRRAGDYCFAIGDFQSAVQYYRLYRDELKNTPKHAMYLASVSESMAYALLLARGASKEVEQLLLDALALYSNSLRSHSIPACAPATEHAHPFLKYTPPVAPTTLAMYPPLWLRTRVLGFLVDVVVMNANALISVPLVQAAQTFPDAVATWQATSPEIARVAAMYKELADLVLSELVSEGGSIASALYSELAATLYLRILPPATHLASKAYFLATQFFLFQKFGVHATRTSVLILGANKEQVPPTAPLFTAPATARVLELLAPGIRTVDPVPKALQFAPAPPPPSLHWQALSYPALYALFLSLLLSKKHASALGVLLLLLQRAKPEQAKHVYIQLSTTDLSQVLDELLATHFSSSVMTYPSIRTLLTLLPLLYYAVTKSSDSEPAPQLLGDKPKRRDSKAEKDREKQKDEEERLERAGVLKEQIYPPSQALVRPPLPLLLASTFQVFHWANSWHQALAEFLAQHANQGHWDPPFAAPATSATRVTLPFADASSAHAAHAADTPPLPLSLSHLALGTGEGSVPGEGLWGPLHADTPVEHYVPPQAETFPAPVVSPAPGVGSPISEWHQIVELFQKDLKFCHSVLPNGVAATNGGNGATAAALRGLFLLSSPSPATTATTAVATSGSSESNPEKAPLPSTSATDPLWDRPCPVDWRVLAEQRASTLVDQEERLSKLPAAPGATIPHDATLAPTVRTPLPPKGLYPLPGGRCLTTPGTHQSLTVSAPCATTPGAGNPLLPHAEQPLLPFDAYLPTKCPLVAYTPLGVRFSLYNPHPFPLLLANVGLKGTVFPTAPEASGPGTHTPNSTPGTHGPPHATTAPAFFHTLHPRAPANLPPLYSPPVHLVLPPHTATPVSLMVYPTVAGKLVVTGVSWELAFPVTSAGGGASTPTTPTAVASPSTLSYLRVPAFVPFSSDPLPAKSDRQPKRHKMLVKSHAESLSAGVLISTFLPNTAATTPPSTASPGTWVSAGGAEFAPVHPTDAHAEPVLIAGAPLAPGAATPASVPGLPATAPPPPTTHPLPVAAPLRLCPGEVRTLWVEVSNTGAVPIQTVTLQYNGRGSVALLPPAPTKAHAKAHAKGIQRGTPTAGAPSTLFGLDGQTLVLPIELATTSPITAPTTPHAIPAPPIPHAKHTLPPGWKAAFPVTLLCLEHAPTPTPLRVLVGVSTLPPQEALATPATAGSLRYSPWCGLVQTHPALVAAGVVTALHADGTGTFQARVCNVLAPGSADSACTPAALLTPTAVSVVSSYWKVAPVAVRTQPLLHLLQSIQHPVPAGGPGIEDAYPAVTDPAQLEAAVLSPLPYLCVRTITYTLTPTCPWAKRLLLPGGVFHSLPPHTPGTSTPVAPGTSVPHAGLAPLTLDFLRLSEAFPRLRTLLDSMVQQERVRRQESEEGAAPTLKGLSEERARNKQEAGGEADGSGGHLPLPTTFFTTLNELRWVLHWKLTDAVAPSLVSSPTPTIAASGTILTRGGILSLAPLVPRDRSVAASAGALPKKLLSTLLLSLKAAETSPAIPSPLPLSPITPTPTPMAPGAPGTPTPGTAVPTRAWSATHLQQSLLLPVERVREPLVHPMDPPLALPTPGTAALPTAPLARFFASVAVYQDDALLTPLSGVPHTTRYRVRQAPLKLFLQLSVAHTPPPRLLSPLLFDARDLRTYAVPGATPTAAGDSTAPGTASAFALSFRPAVPTLVDSQAVPGAVPADPLSGPVGVSNADASISVEGTWVLRGPFARGGVCITDLTPGTQLVLPIECVPLGAGVLDLRASLLYHTLPSGVDLVHTAVLSTEKLPKGVPFLSKAQNVELICNN